MSELNTPTPQASSSSAAVAQTSGEAAVDALASLHHMSTTAGLSSRDYVAVNNTAVFAALLGVGSSLTLLASILLIIPLVGIVVGIVAWRQIARSNGTETGKLLAAGGILISLVFAGGMIGQQVVDAARIRRDTEEVSAIIEGLGKDLATQNYVHAYERFDISFRERVTEPQFASVLTATMQMNRAYLGTFVGCRWNGITPEYYKQGDAQRMALEIVLTFENGGQKPEQRQKVFMTRSGDQWRILEMPDIFDLKAPRKK